MSASIPDIMHRSDDLLMLVSLHLSLDLQAPFFPLSDFALSHSETPAQLSGLDGHQQVLQMTYSWSVTMPSVEVLDLRWRYHHESVDQKIPATLMSSAAILAGLDTLSDADRCFWLPLLYHYKIKSRQFWRRVGDVIAFKLWLRANLMYYCALHRLCLRKMQRHKLWEGFGVWLACSWDTSKAQLTSTGETTSHFVFSSAELNEASHGIYYAASSQF